MNAQHSEYGLIPRNKRPLLAVSQEYPTNGKKPSILYSDRNDAFENEILDSSLLTRGWVVQEIFLSSANLYCLNAQLSWSCCHTSCSETFPTNDNRERQFTDELQQTKNAMMGYSESMRPMESWKSVLLRYSSTNLTFDDDRLVALKGISDVFRSLHLKQLRGAECHSGVWSVDIWKQLMWERVHRPGDTKLPAPKGTTNYLIPTWSPLKDIGSETSDPLSRERFEDVFVLPNRLVSMNTSSLDEFGRASSWKGCQMHLQGVLVGLVLDSIRGFPGTRMAHPAGQADIRLEVRWDGSEKTLATSLPNHQLKALLLVAGYRDVRLIGRFFSLFGITLRPFNLEADLEAPQDARRWVRCGTFRTLADFGQYDTQQEVLEYEHAFQIAQKYGVR